MTNVEAVERAREAFARQDWAHAQQQFAAADADAPLEAEDLELFATASFLVGKDAASDDALTRAHHAWLQSGVTAAAVRCAFWLGFALLNRSELARGGGWIARAQTLLDDSRLDCVEHGLLRLPDALRHLDAGDAAAAHSAFVQALEIGERFDNADLVALAKLGCGQALIRLDEPVRGVALLDETMIAVTSGEVSPLVAGTIYCGVIEACQELFDLRRAQEWTAALASWCATQPDLVPYRGQCLVHRAELMQLLGDWPDAVEEVRRACEWLSGRPAVGAALYQQGELHRLRGELAAAETAYREASRWGRDPEPGLALLRLAQGRVDTAVASLGRALDEASDAPARGKLLGPYVESLLAARDVDAARAAADELARIATDLAAPLLAAQARHASGAVLLAEGQPQAALAALRDAWTIWQRLDAPYEAARARLLIGCACRELGDADGAGLEFDAARWVFERLGAASDLARLRRLAQPTDHAGDGRLTPREREVLTLVAAGRTNRAIADALVISEKTVARHVSNIFTKLGVSSRAAATAYAYDQGLVRPPQAMTKP